MIRSATLAAALTCTTIAMTAPVLADGQLSYTADAGKMGKMQMTESWQGDALRMDIEGMDAYMILRGAEIYSVTAAGGQVMVIPLSQLKNMGAAAGQETTQQDQTGVVFPQEINDMRATGETREVAGIKGDVFEVKWIDNEGAAQTDTAVLTDNALLLEHQKAKLRFIRAISDEPPNPLLMDMQARGLAALSFGDRFRVTDISDDAGPAGNFELPAEPMNLGNMSNMGQP